MSSQASSSLPPPLSVPNQTSTRPNKRVRLPLSCTECRRRKKPCDGEIPNCDACRARNVTHLCRWGDERDLQFQHGTPYMGRVAPSSSPAAPTHSNSFSSSTPISYASGSVSASNQNISGSVEPSTASLNRGQISPSTPSLAKDDRKKHLVNILAQGDLGTACKGATLTDDGDDIRLEKNGTSTLRPSDIAARDLISIFRQHLSWDGLMTFDWDHLYLSCDSGIHLHGKDVEALILLMSASSLESLPASLVISLQYARSFEEIDHLINSWTQNAINLLLALDFYFEPSLYMVQAVNVYQIFLVHRVDKSLMIRLMDLSIRAARRLGIDRLGSAKDDERAWYTADGFVSEAIYSKENLPHHSFGDWAAETFAKRDRIAREIARSHWWIIVTRDWSATRQMGSYLIHKSSFTTAAPSAFASHESEPGRKENIWSYFVTCVEVSRQFSDLCINAATLRSSADTLYDRVLELDHELTKLLEQRPDWLCPESTSQHVWRATVTVDVQGHVISNSSAAIIVSSLIWHRLFLIHRPFLALGLCGREKYRLSAYRPLNNAMLLLQIERQVSSEGLLLMHRSVYLLRLLQAALVIISDQFLRKGSVVDDKELHFRDPLVIHDTLTYAISTFRNLSRNRHGKARDVYDNVHKKLEGLLRACARVPDNAKPGASNEQMLSMISPRNWHVDDFISKAVQQETHPAENLVPSGTDMAELWRDLLPFFSV